MTCIHYHLRSMPETIVEVSYLRKSHAVLALLKGVGFS